MRFAVALVAALAGCSSENVVRNDLPYQGDAWVESRASHVIEKSSLAVVTNNLSDTVSLLDLSKNSVVATVPVDIDPLAVDGPHHAVVDANAEFLYAPFAYPREGAGLGPHAEHGSSQVPGILVKLRVRDLARVGTLTVENNPGDIVMTPDGKRVIVSHFDLLRAIDGLKAKKPLAELRAPLVIVDTATMSRVASPAPCVAGHGMAVTNAKLYLACYGEDAIAVVDLNDPKTSELIPLGAAPSVPPDVVFGPYFVTLGPSGNEVVVSETEGKGFRQIDLATKKTTQRAALAGAVFGPALTRDGASWLVPVQSPDQLVAVDATTFAVKKTRAFTADTCQKPHQIVRRGDRYLLVCEGDHVKPGKIVEVDPSTLETIRSFDVGVYPDVIAFPEGS